MKKIEHGINLKLYKQITKSRSSVNAKNYLADNSITLEVDFENIHSYYPNKLDSDILVCPKGKFHPYNFRNNNYIIPPDFQASENWDVKCYLHDTGYFFVLYGKSEKENFYSSYNGNDLRKISNEMFKTYLYDFIIENGSHKYNGEYKVVNIHSYYNKITLICNIYYLKSDYLERNTLTMISLVDSEKSFSQGTFDENNYLYFIIYNNAKDFISGYSTNSIDIDAISNSYLVPTYINYETPFNFDANIEIEEINFIQKTKYLYYIIKNNHNGKAFYGMINIKMNNSTECLENIPENAYI